MALKGTITGKADNSKYKLTCDWTATQSIANNTSTITAKVYLQAPSGWSTVSSYWDCTINGTQVTNDKSATVGSTAVLLGTRTWTVTHASNGTLSTTISFSYSNGLNSAGTYTTKSGSGSATITLDTIPRTSSFTLSSSSLNMGSSQTVNISRASSSFTHTVQYTFGSNTTTVATKSASTSIAFTPPVSLASQVPNATSGTCTVKVTTYSGSTSIGSASKTFTLKVPASVVPSFDSLGLDGVNLLGGAYVAGKSSVKVSILGAKGAHGSSCNTFHISGAGINSNAWQVTSGALSAGTHTITGKATDSRGRSVSKSGSITVHAYSAPTCTASAFRANQDGSANPSGTYVRLKLNWALSNPGSTNANTRRYQVHWKKTTDSAWTLYKEAQLSGYTGSTTNWDAGGGWATTTSYDIKFTVIDSYGSASATCKVSTISAILNIEKDGVGVGKLREKGVLDIKGHSYIYGTHYFSTDANGHARIGYSNDGLCTFIANGNNNWLRLNDDKTMTYAGYTVFHSNNVNGASGRRWHGTPPIIQTDGVLEVGKYIDFHNSNGSTADFNYRFTCDGGTLWGSGYFRAPRVYTTEWFYSGGNTGWYNETHGGGWYMTDTSWLRSYNNKGVYTGGEIKSGGSMTAEGQYVTIGKYEDKYNAVQFKRYNAGAGGNILGKVGISAQDNGPALALEIGTHASDFALTRRYVFSNASFTVRSNNAVSNGSSQMKWTAVYATNGTIQTSDERFKVKRGYTNTEECFDMIRNTPIYNYITLGENKEELSKNRLGKIALENNKNDINIHMGIMAQDIQKYECSKQILSEGEYEKADGTTGTMLHVNPYNLTSAIMGALQEEIKKREASDARIDELETKVNKLEALIAQLLESK